MKTYVVISSTNEWKLVKRLGLADYPVIITGEGAVNVIRSLKGLPEDTKIINIGYCGSDFFNKGDVVHPGWVATYHEKALINDLKQIKQFRTDVDAICITSTDFVEKPIAFDPNSQPAIYDMELAFICAMFDNVMSIKFVSDKLNKREYDSWVEEDIPS